MAAPIRPTGKRSACCGPCFDRAERGAIQSQRVIRSRRGAECERYRKGATADISNTSNIALQWHSLNGIVFVDLSSVALQKKNFLWEIQGAHPSQHAGIRSVTAQGTQQEAFRPVRRGPDRCRGAGVAIAGLLGRHGSGNGRTDPSLPELLPRASYVEAGACA
jgi:hypothetical protein